MQGCLWKNWRQGCGEEVRTSNEQQLTEELAAAGWMHCSSKQHRALFTTTTSTCLQLKLVARGCNNLKQALQLLLGDLHALLLLLCPACCRYPLAPSTN